MSGQFAVWGGTAGTEAAQIIAEIHLEFISADVQSCQVFLLVIFTTLSPFD